MNELFQWVTQSPLVTRISGIKNAFSGPVSAIFSIATYKKSMEKKSDIYWNASMNETTANALAAADSLYELPFSFPSTKGNPIGKWALKNIFRKGSSKTTTEQTLEDFYASKRVDITVGNPQIIFPDGKTYPVKGNIDIEHLSDIQKSLSNPKLDNSPVRSDSSGRLQGHVEENVYLNDIGGVPTGQAVPVNNGLSNSSGVSDALIKIQQNIPSFNFEALASLGNLGAAAGGSVMGSVLGMITGLGSIAIGAALGGAFGGSGPSSNAFVSGYTLNYHNGGVVPGQGEVPALLKGGETVRTKAQEEELKQILYDKYVGNFIPTVCGAATQPQRQSEQSAPSEQSEQPIHQQITRDDELYILNIIYDAIERNRSGLRNLIQAL